MVPNVYVPYMEFWRSSAWCLHSRWLSVSANCGIILKATFVRRGITVRHICTGDHWRRPHLRRRRHFVGGLGGHFYRWGEWTSTLCGAIGVSILATWRQLNTAHRALFPLMALIVRKIICCHICWPHAVRFVDIWSLPIVSCTNGMVWSEQLVQRYRFNRMQHDRFENFWDPILRTFLEDFSRMESNWTLFILKLQLSFRLSLLCPVEDVECYCCGPNLEVLNKINK